jgi:hypothetical protein
MLMAVYCLANLYCVNIFVQGVWDSPISRQSSIFHRMVELFYLISMEQHADVTFNNVVAQKGETMS